MTTFSPRALRMRPMAAAVTPLPTELTTPPVQKMYLGMRSYLFSSLARYDTLKREAGRLDRCVVSPPLLRRWNGPPRGPPCCSDQLFKVVCCSLHIQKHQPELCALTDQCRQYGFFADRHQDDEPVFPADVHLIERATP